MRIPTVLRLAALAATLAVATPLAAQQRAPGGADTVPAADGPLSYPMTFDTMEVYLLSLVPPESRGNVRNLELTGAGQELKVDSEVRIGAIPGFELLAPLGWARLTATGPVRVLKRGVVVWDVRSMQLGGREVPQSVWENLLHVATKREDTLVPFRVGAWVTRVEVEGERMVLYRQ